MKQLSLTTILTAAAGARILSQRGATLGSDAALVAALGDELAGLDLDQDDEARLGATLRGAVLASRRRMLGGEPPASLMAALPIGEADAEAHTSNAARSRRLGGGGLLLRVGPLLGGDNDMSSEGWEADPSHTPAAAVRGARSGAYHPRRAAPLLGALPGSEGDEDAPSCYDRSTRRAAGGGVMGRMRCGAMAAEEEGAEARPGQRLGGAAGGGAAGGGGVGGGAAGELALEEGNEGAAARAAARAATETAAVKVLVARQSCELRLGEAREAAPGQRRARDLLSGQLELELELGETNEETAASARGVSSGHAELAELDERELELGEVDEEVLAVSVRVVPGAHSTWHAELSELGELGEADEEATAQRRGGPSARGAHHTELLELGELGEAGEEVAAQRRGGRRARHPELPELGELGEAGEEGAAQRQGGLGARGARHPELLELNGLGETGEEVAAATQRGLSACNAYHAEVLELGELGEAGEEAVASARRGAGIRVAVLHAHCICIEVGTWACRPIH